MAEMEIPLEIGSLDALKKFLSDHAGAEKAEEVTRKLKGVIDQVKDLPPEEKKAYLAQFGERMKNVKEAVQEKIAEQVQFVITINIIVQIVVFALIAILVLWILVFIGRKLYKAVTAKERRQAEKKKLKEERKTKQKDESKKGKKPKEEGDKKEKKKKN